MQTKLFVLSTDLIQDLPDRKVHALGKQTLIALGIRQVSWRTARRTRPCASSCSQCLQPSLRESIPLSFSILIRLFFLSFRFPLACPTNAFPLMFILLLISFHHFSLSLTLGLLPFCLPTSFSLSTSWVITSLSHFSLSAPSGSLSLYVIHSLSVTSPRESP